MTVASLQQVGSLEVIVVVQQHWAILDIVDIRANPVHTVCRFDGNHVVLAWFAEDAVG